MFKQFVKEHVDAIICGLAVTIIIAGMIGATVMRFGNTKPASESYLDYQVSQINANIDELEDLNKQMWTAIANEANQ